MTAATMRREELLTYVALRLGRELGADVQEVLSRKEAADPSVRILHLAELMATRGTLDGGVRIPNTVGDVTVVADLRARQVITSVRLSAPQEGRTTTRINWLLRQLKNSPEDVRVDAFGLRSRTSVSELLSAARDKPTLLVPGDGKELATFTISLVCPMGLKRGTGRKSFIDSVLSTIDEFYREVVQQLREWQPKAPELQRSQRAPASEPTSATPPSTGELVVAPPEPSAAIRSGHYETPEEPRSP